MTTTDLTPIYTSLLAEWADTAALDTLGSPAAPPPPDDEPGGAPTS